MPHDVPTNATLAELLAREADTADGYLRRAFRRASRAALLWPVEASALLSEGRSLTELRGIGPYLAVRLRGWLESVPPALAPPPLRRGFLTLAEARAILAQHPGALAAVRGDLQMHTEWSDGTATLLAMARAAADRGYAWVAVTDHSKGLHIANGLDETRLAAQQAAIEAANLTLRAEGRAFGLLRGIEMNLSPAGGGDMAPESLAALDVVLGAFHSALRRTDDQTDRYLAAVRNRDVHVLAHPRGRIYNFRLGLSADWPRVFAEAAALDKAIEIDAYADRQDVDVGLLAEARRAGVRISIGSDAHSPRELAMMELGLAAALGAGIPRDRILNYLSAEDLVAWAAGRRRN